MSLLSGRYSLEVTTRDAPSVAHLMLDQLTSTAAADRVVVIAGDQGQELGPYSDALRIIESGRFAHHGVRRVGIGGYPEGHPIANIPIGTSFQLVAGPEVAMDAGGVESLVESVDLRVEN